MTELTGVGAQLREAREALGMGIDDVAQQLKFAPRQIEALESEQFGRLPGPTIARGMVRNYARLLKLDPEPLLERAAAQLRSATDPEELAARLGKPVPFSEGARRGSYAYLGFSLAILALVGAVAYQWRQEAPRAPVPAAVQPVSAPVRGDAAQQVQSEPLPVSGAAESVKEEPQQKAGLQQRVVAVEPAPVAAAPTALPVLEKPAPAALPESAAVALDTLVLQSAEESWMEVRDATGEVLLASLIPAGTERVVHGRPPFQLVVGNAQHVRLRHNDKPVDLRPYTRGDVARLTLK